MPSGEDFSGRFVVEIDNDGVGVNGGNVGEEERLLSAGKEGKKMGDRPSFFKAEFLLDDKGIFRACLETGDQIKTK